MTRADPEAQALALIADSARTLGHAHRLALLEHIAQGERPVERLARLTGLSVANASQHLQHLKRAGFVDSRREGKQVLYRLAEGPVVDVLMALRAFAEHARAEIRELMAAARARGDGAGPISRAELVRRLREDGVTLLDVRSPEEFEQGHLPGALNIPSSELQRRLGDIPPDQEIVAYCRGPYCVLSRDAVEALRARGYRARGMEDGFPEWKAAGLQVATGR